MKEKTLFFLVQIPEWLFFSLCLAGGLVTNLSLRFDNKLYGSLVLTGINVCVIVIAIIFEIFFKKWQRLGLRYAKYAKDGNDSLEANHAKKAMTYFLKAALGKGPEPLVNLGLCYAAGFGVEKNLVKAAKCYRMAANSWILRKKRKSTARLALGVCYAEGIGVEKDMVKADDLFKSNGYSGDLEKYWNPTEVLMWVRKAAEWGVAKAQCDQGNCSAT